MIAHASSEKNVCPHCIGRALCDCSACGQKVRYIDFGGKWHKYYESGICRKCHGKGVVTIR